MLLLAKGMTDVQNGNVFTLEQIVQEVKQKYGF